MVPIIVRNGTKLLQIYAILDDGAKCAIILPAAARHLGLKGRAESLTLLTVDQDVVYLTGASVYFHVASPAIPSNYYLITLFTLPLQSFINVQPLLLIGADYTHLITAIGPVRLGPKGGPVAIHTALGWALQGPDGSQANATSCYFTTYRLTTDDIYQYVERLWQLDVLPFRSERLEVRSRLDQEAVSILEARTERVKIGDTLRYATPLLRAKGAPPLKADFEAVMPKLRSTERKILKDPVKAKRYDAEIQKLLDKYKPAPASHGLYLTTSSITIKKTSPGLKLLLYLWWPLSKRTATPGSNPWTIFYWSPPAFPPPFCRHQWRHPSHVSPGLTPALAPVTAEVCLEKLTKRETA